MAASKEEREQGVSTLSAPKMAESESVVVESLESPPLVNGCRSAGSDGDGEEDDHLRASKTSTAEAGDEVAEAGNDLINGHAELSEACSLPSPPAKLAVGDVSTPDQPPPPPTLQSSNEISPSGSTSGSPEVQAAPVDSVVPDVSAMVENGTCGSGTENEMAPVEVLESGEKLDPPGDAQDPLDAGNLEQISSQEASKGTLQAEALFEAMDEKGDDKTKEDRPAPSGDCEKSEASERETVNSCPENEVKDEETGSRSDNSDREKTVTVETSETAMEDADDGVSVGSKMETSVPDTEEVGRTDCSSASTPADPSLHPSLSAPGKNAPSETALGEAPVDLVPADSSEDTLKKEPLCKTSPPVKDAESDPPKLAPVKAPASKEVPRVPKARKSGLPAACHGVKTVNFNPITRIIFNLDDRRSINLSKSGGRVSDDLEDTKDTKKEAGQEEGDGNSSEPESEEVASCLTETSAEKDNPSDRKPKVIRKKRRLGTYNFPDSKKKKKKLQATSPSGTSDPEPGSDSRVSRSALMGARGVRRQAMSEGQRSPAHTARRQFTARSPMRLGERSSLMEVLSRNSHLAFSSPRPRRYGLRGRRQGQELHRGKNLMELWRQQTLTKAAAARNSSSRVAGEEERGKSTASPAAPATMPEESKEDVVMEPAIRKSLRKRKTAEGSEQAESPSALDSDSNSSCSSSAKRRRRSEEDKSEAPVPLSSASAISAVPVAGVTVAVASGGQSGPVVTIVSEHSPVQPGLRSLLAPRAQPPLPPTTSPRTTASSSATTAFSVTVARPSPGVGNSDALRALLTSTTPMLGHHGLTSAARNVSASAASSSSSSSSLSSLSSTCNGEEKPSGGTPNGLSVYPVTPPHTPDEACNGESGQASLPAGTEMPRSEVPPLCCCKMNGASLARLVSSGTYCQALDSVDGKVLGCCEKVTSSVMVRPAVTIPFIAVCENHRLRLKLHQCCPGCGHFCVQGRFFQCGKDSDQMPHMFHELCVTVRGNQQFCPHCGSDSEQCEVQLRMDEPRRLSGLENLRPKYTTFRARMSLTKATSRGAKDGDSSDSSAVKYTLSSTANKILSSDGLPVCPGRGELERVLNCLTQERPKKYRTLPKNVYSPASEGDLEKVIYMLVDGADPNKPCAEEDDRSPLHAAVLSGNLALCQILVQAGAEVHRKDRNLRTALMLAAEADQVAILQYLIKAGATKTDRGEDGMTCLHMAAKLGNLASVRYLVEKEHMDMNIQDDGGWTPMIWAAESQFIETVRYLIKAGADPEIMDDEENTGLHWAAFAGSVEISEMFLNHGCDPDRPNEHGDRPLHIAARQEHYACVVLMLSRGADIEVKNNQGETPISVCIDQTSQTCTALKVNRQLRNVAARRLPRAERLLHRDVSMGREKNPIACVNAVDEEPFPTDYLYVAENIITSHLPINRVITSLQSCRCRDNCSSLTCVCSRSSVKCWYDNMGRMVGFNPLDPPLVFECNPACRCWTNCNNRVVQNGITCRLELFRTEGRGWGVKTLTEIPQGTFVCEYIGELISDQEADRCEDDSYLFDLDNKDGETYCIDARKYGNISRFINHLCDPNLITVKVFTDHQDLRFPHICFFASRTIKAHEELGFDYGEKFWIIKWKQFTCACGSPKCKYSKDVIHKTLEEYRLRHEEENTATES